MSDKTWQVYLSGEIHTDWRGEIASDAKKLGLPVKFTSPITDHGASDGCGQVILGADESATAAPEGFWKDHQAAKINGIRTRTLIGEADLLVIRFGEKFRQWNAAYEAGIAAAMGKPYITLHDHSLVHALKEVDAGACAWCEDVSQVAEILAYVLSGNTDQPDLRKIDLNK